MVMPITHKLKGTLFMGFAWICSVFRSQLNNVYLLEPLMPQVTASNHIQQLWLECMLNNDFVFLGYINFLHQTKSLLRNLVLFC
jgi:hypothetical protein